MRTGYSLTEVTEFNQTDVLNSRPGGFCSGRKRPEHDSVYDASARITVRFEWGKTLGIYDSNRAASSHIEMSYSER